jgi:hypothetical protein
MAARRLQLLAQLQQGCLLWGLLELQQLLGLQ